MKRLRVTHYKFDDDGKAIKVSDVDEAFYTIKEVRSRTSPEVVDVEINYISNYVRCVVDETKDYYCKACLYGRECWRVKQTKEELGWSEDGK